MTKAQQKELESQVGNVFKLSKDPSPELHVILRRVIPAMKSGEYTMSASVSLGYCDKDGNIIGSGFGGINMSATKFIKNFFKSK